jgi:TfoX/Sxy family transcriptional regulator of competence genes
VLKEAPVSDADTAADAPGGADPRDALARRVRERLASHGDVREVNMFGGLSFMVDERLSVAAGREGDLLVRVGAADYDDLLERGAVAAVMRNGRPMGRGWLSVPSARIAEDAELAGWVDVGLRAAAAAG